MKKIFIISLATLAISACSNSIKIGDYAKVGRGDQVPAFTITDVSQAVTFNSRTAGVPVLIYLLWSECGDCKEATPAVMNIWKSFIDDNTVQLVCISREGSNHASQELAETYWNSVGTNIAPTPMPPLYYDQNRVVYDMFATQGVPRFCVVDADGIIRWHKEGVATEEDILTELLAAKLPMEEVEEE